MILITDIKIKKYDGDQAQIIKQKYEELYLPMVTEEVNDRMAELEHIKGRRFINSNGEEVVIGMDKESQKLIGLPLDAFDSILEREQITRDILRQNRITMQLMVDRIDAFNKLGFFSRAKILLFGGKI